MLTRFRPEPGRLPHRPPGSVLRSFPVLARLSVALILVLGIGVGGAGPAGAHTGFESSDPGDGQQVSGPVDRITLVFSGDAAPAGEGFQVQESSGTAREPTDATTDDGRTWTLQFDPPLESGAVGVRWSVAAPDSHPIDGSFSFRTLDGPEISGDASAASPAGAVSTSSADLESFLQTGARIPSWPAWVGALGRVLSMVGTLFGIGALVFAITSLRGTRDEVGRVVYWIRRCGLLVVGGAFLELVAGVGVGASTSSSNLWSPSVLFGVLWSSVGAAVALRIFSGVGLVMGPQIVMVRADFAPDPVGALRQVVRVGQASSGPPSCVTVPSAEWGDGAERAVERASEWTLTGGRSPWAFLAAGALLLSFAFDGHTVAKGNRLLMGATDILHVGAGAVWLGGVTVLTLLLWRRHRRGRDLEALPLVVRFSVVASLGLLVAGGAGLAMTFMILDSPSQLWSTPWGQLLVAKTFFVAVAAAGGAYNHWVLVPELGGSDDEKVAQQLRRVVTGESIALLVVAALTAMLVAAEDVILVVRGDRPDVEGTRRMDAPELAATVGG